MSYRAKTVVTLTGIPRETLLAWERRYDILEPRRTAGGHRLYTEQDVAVLRQLKKLVDGGLSISEAVLQVRQQPVPSGAAAGSLMLEVFEALARYDREAVDALMPRVRQLNFVEALEQIYLPVLREAGDRWANGRCSIAQEHYISGWCREQLLSIRHGLGAGPLHGPRAVCAVAPAEAHELGLMALSIWLSLWGWRVTWLGANLPVDELARYVAAERPRLVCLSATLDPGQEVLQAWAGQLRQAAPPSTLIALGGEGTRGFQPLSGVFRCEDPGELEEILRTTEVPA
jgi:DNA-binding transcriptional MerR regulator/methylmalonyl-CoA mutase cobalamin-binding subunit